MDSGNREKEKAHILKTWGVVIESGIMLFPSGDAEFDQMPPAKPGIGYVGLRLLLKIGKTLIYTVFSLFFYLWLLGASWCNFAKSIFHMFQNVCSIAYIA